MWSSFVSKIRCHIVIITVFDCLVSVCGHAQCACIARGGRNTSQLYVQDLKKVPFGSPGQVDFLSRQITFKALLPNEQRVQASHPVTKSLPKTSKKWSWETEM